MDGTVVSPDPVPTNQRIVRSTRLELELPEEEGTRSYADIVEDSHIQDIVADDQVNKSWRGKLDKGNHVAYVVLGSTNKVGVTQVIANPQQERKVTAHIHVAVWENLSMR